jgi:hypothetical protein
MKPADNDYYRKCPKCGSILIRTITVIQNNGSNVHKEMRVCLYSLCGYTEDIKDE